MAPLAKTVPDTVLVVCMRRIGDVLLATPIARSIKAAWPQAQVDMLVFKGTEGVLRGNADLREVVESGNFNVQLGLDSHDVLEGSFELV